MVVILYYFILIFFNFRVDQRARSPKKSRESYTWKEARVRRATELQQRSLAGSLVGRFARHNRDLDNHSHDDDDDGDGNENVKKAIGLITRQQLCTCITLFCTFLCLHCTTTTWKCLISRFREEETRATTKFPLSFWTWIWFLGIQL